MTKHQIFDRLLKLGVLESLSEISFPLPPNTDNNTPASSLYKTSKNSTEKMTLTKNEAISHNVSIKDIMEIQIEGKGDNLSLGQRQLICICRAIIKQPKILLMDEATASIDQKTDELI